MRVRVGVHAQHGRHRRRRCGRRTSTDLGAPSSGRRRKHSWSVAAVHGLGSAQVLRVAELGERHLHRRQGSHNFAVCFFLPLCIHVPEKTKQRVLKVVEAKKRKGMKRRGLKKALKKSTEVFFFQAERKKESGGGC